MSLPLIGQTEQSAQLIQKITPGGFSLLSCRRWFSAYDQCSLSQGQQLLVPVHVFNDDVAPIIKQPARLSSMGYPKISVIWLTYLWACVIILMLSGQKDRIVCSIFHIGSEMKGESVITQVLFIIGEKRYAKDEVKSQEE